jgi:hypothetical protein
MHMKYATSGARVTVNCPDDLGLYVQFASREESKVQRAGDSLYVCPFTLLPYQRMAVRFWDKAKSEEWKRRARDVVGINAPSP